jgi:hypothetical protein
VGGSVDDGFEGGSAMVVDGAMGTRKGVGMGRAGGAPESAPLGAYEPESWSREVEVYA